MTTNVPPISETSTYQRLQEASVPEGIRPKYKKRELALAAVFSGASIQETSEHFEVDRTTLTRMVQIAAQIAPDGKPYGYRVCIPYLRVQKPQHDTNTMPASARANAFNHLLATLPELSALIIKYVGRLPTHNEPSPKFENLFREFKKYLKKKDLALFYPLNSPDEGRRALLNWLKRYRKALKDSEMVINEDGTFTISRLDQVFLLLPLDRVEFDGHKIDNDSYGYVPTPDGTWLAKKLSAIWILASLDVSSLCAFPPHVIVSKSYDFVDVLEALSNLLKPWEKRDLIVPNLKYPSGAWMPTMVGTYDKILRLAGLAVDNAFSHNAKITTKNFGEHLLGVVNLGYPGVPEGRPNIEAYFKRIKRAVLDFIAGGSKPANSRGGEKVQVSDKSGGDYPVFIDALRDLVDVETAAYNITPHPSLQNRTPKDVFEAHLKAGLWTTQSAHTEAHAREILAIHMKVTIRGNKDKGVLPYVKSDYGKYRAKSLNKRYDLLGKTFTATIYADEAHHMHLWDTNGNLFVLLHGLRPWRTPHTLKQRVEICKCVRNGLLTIEGTDNAVLAYHDYVRAKAAELQWATDAYVRNNLHGTHAAAPSVKPTPFSHLTSLADLKPLGGVVDLRPRRKSL
ncbi:hypothetical protein IMW82_02840 [Rhodanobacter sp. B2A1Ga4]|uniref:hypothetical protein n=1 Tax=Rhodanobacter sp. B2A1Ga4 TaxID=2778647 RepID=UPI001B3865D0|nr:hypothetical protein [Rhodanobacter sp. B2A1Ga4]MBQ4853614.1 hypothetical protein [Rhodanobacter sp. B2A1Ga4]